MTHPSTPDAAVSLRFRKKPVVIEAVQFTQAVRDAYLFDGGLLPAGVQIFASNTHPGRREVYRADAYIKTLEGNMSVTLDDWIITGVNGEHYPCKPDIFAKTYEPAEAAQSLAQQHALELLSLDGQAMERESALVAERDALRAMVEDVSTEVHLLRAALVYIAEESDDMVALKCAQEALAAPAVGVE